MKIIFTELFFSRLEDIIEFIAEDSTNQARKFKTNIFKEIRTLQKFPYRCRKSIYFDDENIRDLIFKGYSITYRIKETTIEVFGITKYQDNPYIS